MTNLSEFVALPGRGKSMFCVDPRFTAVTVAEDPALPAEDPFAVTYAEGFAAGVEQAQAEAEARAASEAEARAALTLSLERLDAEMAEMFRQRLEDTVIALCEATLAPLALDRDAVVARAERACAMFSRAEDDRVIRLHPDDVTFVKKSLAANWNILPDPSLPRGSLRVETASGGLEDGPEQWRQAIIETVRSC